MDVPQARRIERPRWVNARVALGVSLFVVSLVGGQRLVADAQTLHPMWVAERDLPPGTVIEEGDLRIGEFNLSASLLPLYATGSTPVLGAVVTDAVHAGEMVPISGIAEVQAAVEGRLMTIPMGDSGLVGGVLHAGDQVDVLATFSAGQAGSITRTIVAAAEVVDVLKSDGFVPSGEAIAGVTIRVAPDDAPRLAFAIRNAEIDLAIISGLPGDEVRAAVTEGDFRR